MKSTGYESAQLRGYLNSLGVPVFVRALNPARVKRLSGVCKELELSELVQGALPGKRSYPLLVKWQGASYLVSDNLESHMALWQGQPVPKPHRCCANNNCELLNKVCVVTGGAQGFGAGIAQGLLEKGAIVVAADINQEAGARFVRDCNLCFPGQRAFFHMLNVADSASWGVLGAFLLEQFGGIDVLVSNAGVLKAGPLGTLTEKEFDLVTAVNYKGYYLGVQAISPIMARQNSAALSHWSDIIQINSKSGLEGSNKNFAYAGGKFGGIGLTQSFALELVEKRIKVNAVCPGNFFDGPLWSDPEKGLFVQYLAARKVPGAKTIEDVRAFYEAKVPMGRGCTVEDVVTAIRYIIEQKYETGQAVPVTGGQVMLN